MRTKLDILSLTAAALLFASASRDAQAIAITDVGDPDLLVASAQLGNSSEQIVTEWVASVLGEAVEFLQTTRTPQFGTFELVTGGIDPLTYAFDFGTSDMPNYFLLKTGSGSTTGDRHFLYQNLASLRYGVFTLTELGFGVRGFVGIEKVTHVKEFMVPEPATLTLLGLGFLALGFVSRSNRRGQFRNSGSRAA